MHKVIKRGAQVAAATAVLLVLGGTANAAAPGPASVSGNFNPAQGNACQGPNDQPNCPGPQH